MLAGCVTTPQLHYLVRGYTSHGVYGDASEDGYYMKLGLAFWKLNGSQVALVSVLLVCLSVYSVFQFTCHDLPP